LPEKASTGFPFFLKVRFAMGWDKKLTQNIDCQICTGTPTDCTLLEEIIAKTKD